MPEIHGLLGWRNRTASEVHLVARKISLRLCVDTKLFASRLGAEWATQSVTLNVLNSENAPSSNISMK